LGAGIVFQVAAEAAKMTPVQIWVSRTYFGRVPKSLTEWDGVADEGKFTEWKTEYQALDTLKQALAHGK